MTSIAYADLSSCSPAENPYLHHLLKIEWHIFGTLTWNSQARRVGAEWLREIDFNRRIGATAQHYRLRAKRLAYYRTLEHGSGERHYHFLLARRGLEAIPADELARTMEYIWQSRLQGLYLKEAGMGRAVVRAFDAARHERCVRYCLKRQVDERGLPRESFDYPSPALRRLILESTDTL